MKKFVLIGGIVFLITMLFTIPASIASKLLPNHIKASQFDGNIWQGSASTLIINQLNLGSVQWEIHPSCFLILKLCADIKQTNHELSSSFSINQRNATVFKNLNANGDASILNSFLNKYGLTLTGDFEAELDQLSIVEQRIENIDGDIRFKQLAVNGVLRVLLGDLDSVFEPQKEYTLVRLTNDHGHVDLSGMAHLFEDMSYELDMSVRQNQKSTDAVINGMQFIGDQQADGSVRIKRNGNLAF